MTFSLIPDLEQPAIERLFSTCRQWIARSSHKYMPFIYGPTATSSVSQAQEAAEKFVDQVEAAVSSNKGIEEAEATQWKEMTGLTRLLLELERQ